MTTMNDDKDNNNHPNNTSSTEHVTTRYPGIYLTIILFLSCLSPLHFPFVCLFVQLWLKLMVGITDRLLTTASEDPLGQLLAPQVLKVLGM